jgi:hypothetical protein
VSSQTRKGPYHDDETIVVPRNRRNVRLARHGAGDLVPGGTIEVPGARGHGSDRLGIGRLVFKALNVVEVAFAIVLLIAVAMVKPPGRVVTSVMTAIVALVVQVAVIRPLLTARSDRVLAGEEAPRSVGHYWYVGLEVVKVVALFTSGVLLLAL